MGADEEVGVPAGEAEPRSIADRLWTPRWVERLPRRWLDRWLPGDQRELAIQLGITALLVMLARSLGSTLFLATPLLLGHVPEWAMQAIPSLVAAVLIIAVIVVLRRGLGAPSIVVGFVLLASAIGVLGYGALMAALPTLLSGQGVDVFWVGRTLLPLVAILVGGLLGEPRLSRLVDPDEDSDRMFDVAGVGGWFADSLGLGSRTDPDDKRLVFWALLPGAVIVAVPLAVNGLLAVSGLRARMYGAAQVGIDDAALRTQQMWSIGVLAVVGVLTVLTLFVAIRWAVRSKRAPRALWAPSGITQLASALAFVLIWLPGAVMTLGHLGSAASNTVGFETAAYLYGVVSALTAVLYPVALLVAVPRPSATPAAPEPATIEPRPDASDASGRPSASAMEETQ